jgi:hypothetical protein
MLLRCIFSISTSPQANSESTGGPREAVTAIKNPVTHSAFHAGNEEGLLLIEFLKPRKLGVNPVKDSHRAGRQF